MIYSINEINVDQYYQRKKEMIENQEQQERDKKRRSNYQSQYSPSLRGSNAADIDRGDPRYTPNSI